MIYIDGHWETIYDLEDAVRIVREYYNEELADKMDELIDQLVDAFNDKIEELIEETYTYNDDYLCGDWCDD